MSDHPELNERQKMIETSGDAIAKALEYCLKQELKNTALHNLATSDVPNLSEACEHLLAKGADIDYKNKHGDTPLIHAVKNNKIELVKLLLKHGADVEAYNNNSNTALTKCIIMNNIEIVKILIKHGAKGNDPVQHAAMMGNEPILKLLLENGFDEDKRSRNAGLKAIVEKESDNIMRYFSQESVKKVELLLNHGADVNSLLDILQEPLQVPSYYHVRDRPPLLRILHMNMAETILRHIAKLLALEQLVRPELIDYFNRMDWQSEYLTRCIDELERAKNKRVNKTWITFFDLLFYDRQRMVNVIGNQAIVSKVRSQVKKKRYPIFGNELKNSVDRAINDQLLRKLASFALSECVPMWSSDSLIVNGVLDCMGMDNVVKFIENFKLAQT